MSAVGRYPLTLCLKLLGQSLPNVVYSTCKVRRQEIVNLDPGVWVIMFKGLNFRGNRFKLMYMYWFVFILISSLLLVSKYQTSWCLLGVFRPIREFFTHMNTSPIPVEILTYARHLWSLSSEGSLVYHTHCDMFGHPLMMDISEDL